MNIPRFLKSKVSMFAIGAVFFALFLQTSVSTSFADSMTRMVQEALTEKGFDPGPVDGVWGSKTKAAVMQFQESAGLTANGQVDGPTKSGLLSGASVSQSSAVAVSMPTTPAFSEDDTGPDAVDSDIAWGRHKS
jgi:peptidoglycan hydrolase-like protein with peptidoglycan-binding domain